MLFKAVLSVFLLVVVCQAAPEASIQGRIMGGEQAQLRQFTFLVSVRNQTGYMCGGTILSNFYVLTAAHCVASISEDGTVSVTPAENLLVHLGSNDRFSGGQYREITQVTVHEDYGKFKNDIALLRVKDLINYSMSVDPILLPSENTPADAEITIAGWGSEANDNYYARYIRWNTLTSLSEKQCQKDFAFANPGLLCLSHPANNGACFGDGGSPAIYKDRVVGIASFVDGQCGSANPDGYTRVFYYRDWIRAHSDVY